MIYKHLKNDELFKSFYELRENTLKKVKNNSGFDHLPKTNIANLNFQTSDFIDETISIRKIDYYFSNSIARASKTMSDCRVERYENFKSKTAS